MPPKNKNPAPVRGEIISRGTTLMTLWPLGTVNDVPLGLFFPKAQE